MKNEMCFENSEKGSREQRLKVSKQTWDCEKEFWRGEA